MTKYEPYKRQTVHKTLSCDLTPDEISTYSMELASITTEQSEIEGEKKEIMSTFTARLNKCIADGRVLARKITTKKEDRQIECELDFDYAKGMVYTVRTDTGVTIGQRKLSDEERQQWLDLEAEQDRRDDAEDRRNEQASDVGVIEGELLQIEHKTDSVVTDSVATDSAAPDSESTDFQSHEVEICGNSDCHYHDASEGNGCKQYEMVWECKQAFQEGTEKTEVHEDCARCKSSHPSCDKCCETCEDQCNASQICMIKEAEAEKEAEKLAEADRRSSICKTWEECQHKEICFVPENEIAGICFIDEPYKIPTPPVVLTFPELMQWGWNRNEAKLLSAGFSLVKYDRDNKQLVVSCEDPRGGWMKLPARETFAAAERDLETMVIDGLIEVAGNSKGSVCGHKCIHKLRAAGFEFYRNGGDRIKYGDSWKTWKKFDDSKDCLQAWEALLSSDAKALED